MRSAAEFAMVERLVAEGLNDCDVSRLTGIPRTTVRDWRQTGFEKEELGRLDPGEPHQHDFTRLPPSYAYLLGLYLGDGCISQHARGVYRLRITLDSAYPMIIAACRASMARVMPSSRASVQVRHGSEVSTSGPIRSTGRASFRSTGPDPSTTDGSCSPTGSARSVTRRPSCSSEV